MIVGLNSSAATPPAPPSKPAEPAFPATSQAPVAQAQPVDMVCRAEQQPAALIGTSLLKTLATHDFTSWFPQGPLPPNASVTDANGYRYTSDMFGRPVTASGDLSKNPAPALTRDSAARAAQRAAGGGDRLPTDEGGHSLGNQFFGRNDAWNLTPQDGNLNHSAYRAMENSWSSTLGKRGHRLGGNTRGVRFAHPAPDRARFLVFAERRRAGVARHGKRAERRLHPVA